MRKGLMNISKRCMVAIMSSVMLMSSVTVSMAFPIGVYAEDNDKYIDELDHDIYENTGRINSVKNAVSVQINNGLIGYNKGTVVDNNHTDTNAFDVVENEGTVVNNYGIIKNNSRTVTNNYGTIENNQRNITNQYDGTVRVNTIGSITNYFGGNIPVTPTGNVTNNYADITDATPADAVNAPNQFRSVTISNNNITAEYGDGFTEKVVDKEGNKKQFIQVTRDQQALEDVTGVITISPKAGYELSFADSFPVNETYGYELNMDEGKYYLTIYRPTASLTISPENIGLVISQLKKAGILPENTDVEVTTSNVDENDSAQDTSVSRPAAVNPNMVEGYFAVNGQLLPGVVFGKTTQGVAAEAVFNANRPAGWNAAFSYNMAIKGKVDYTLKNGVMSIIIPKEIQKAGRTFAIMALDKNGKAWTFSDTDTNPATITGTINVEGYAFYLIYKD